MGDYPKTSPLTIVLAVVTIMASVVTAVPVFMGYTQDKPLVYYEVTTISVLNRSSPDFEQARTSLELQGIPDARAVVQITNKGTGQARDVGVSIRPAGEIQTFETLPDSSSMPVWVGIPVGRSAFDGNDAARFNLKNFGVGRVFEIHVGYRVDSSAGPSAEVDVFYDGREGLLSEDLDSAAPLTALSAFRIPLLIFAGGTILTLLVAGLVVLGRNPEYATVLREISAEAVRIMVASVGIGLGRR